MSEKVRDRDGGKNKIKRKKKSVRNSQNKKCREHCSRNVMNKSDLPINIGSKTNKMKFQKSKTLYEGRRKYLPHFHERIIIIFHICEINI